MKKYFNSIAKTTLVLVYLVIVAGAVVRMTGSGMGCPDWPKCFGYYIPPTNAEQLVWKPDHAYKKGQVIILEETLKVAAKDFTSANNFEATNWEKYTKHDYAIFNPYHTWTEFINRLVGALAGLATLIMAIASFSLWKKKKAITILSWLVVFAMGFQAWLGATVVYSVLLPQKITVHMVMALVIVAMILYVLYLNSETTTKQKKFKPFTLVNILAIVFTLIQIVLGTQVRQFVDIQADIYGEHAKQLWLSDPSWQFYIHRSFSIIVLLINAFLFWKNKQLLLGYSKINWVIALLLVEVVSGIVMFYFHFPFTSQTIHLVVASIIFGIQFYLLLENKKAVAH